MIDASTFAISYNAFWNANTPMCEHFVRRVNLAGVERFGLPMPTSSSPEQRALIAEYAFSLFVERKLDENSGEERRPSDVIELAAWTATEVRLRPYVGKGLSFERALDVESKLEVGELLERLSRFFNDGPHKCILRPLFRGCGFVDASEGDIISDGTVFEVKTVERSFRSADIRQTITYAALNYASGQYDISRVGLLNPRRGLYYDVDLGELCFEVSGRPAPDLFSIIIQAISSGEISR